MSDINAIQIQSNADETIVQFPTVFFAKTLTTIANILTGPHLVTPAVPLTAPVNFLLPLQSEYRKIKVRHELSVVLQIASTGTAPFANVPVRLFGYEANGTGGTLPIEYDGAKLNLSMLPPRNTVALAAKTLKKITVNNFKLIFAVDTFNLAAQAPEYVPNPAALSNILAAYKLTAYFKK